MPAKTVIAVSVSNNTETETVDISKLLRVMNKQLMTVSALRSDSPKNRREITVDLKSYSILVSQYLLCMPVTKDL